MPLGNANQSKVYWGRQTARGTQTPWANFKDTVVETTRGALVPEINFSTVQRNKGNFRPSVSTPGQTRSGGNLTIVQDADKYGFAWDQCMYKTATSLQVANAKFNTIPAPSSAMSNDTAETAATIVTTPGATNPQPRYRLVHAATYPNGNPRLVCSRVVFETTDANWVASAAGSYIKVIGTDFDGDYLEEDLWFRRSDTDVTATGTIASGVTRTSTRYFATVVSMTPVGWGTAALGKLDSDPRDYYYHKADMGNSLPLPVTIVQVKGTIPDTYTDMLVASWRYQSSAQNELEMTFQGGDAKPGENAQGTTANPSITNEERPSGLAAPQYGTRIAIDDVVIRSGEGSISCNHNLGQDENPNYGTRAAPAPIITAPREIVGAFRISHHAQTEAGADVAFLPFYQKSLGSDVSFYLETQLMDWGSAFNNWRVTCPNARHTRPPTPADVSTGQIHNQIQLTAYGKGSDPDCTFESWNTSNATAFNS